MGFMDKLGSAAATAKWKADQQMRVMRVQNNIRDLENQVKSQKMALGDTALGLYSQGSLAEEPLQQICAEIGRINEQVAQLNQNLRQIQAEQPPSENQPASAPAPAAYAPPPVPESTAPATAPAPDPAPQPAVLVCPECGQVLKGRFCPEHGREGVPAGG
ncbi:MAG: hypothetical protein M1281_17100 [Chloroflexi bacterium]|nr:hypothetical protein [Chloroflexota bacterium]